MEQEHPRRLGEHVRRRRLDVGWTLDVAARRLGISRRLLIQIEAGAANPSLSSLLSIAAGFEVPLADLLGGEDKPILTIQPDNATAPALWTGSAGGAGRLLVACGGLELWAWALQPGDERRSAAHRRGATEALTVTAGVVTLEVGAESLVLRRGQSAAFQADREHRYANDSARPASFYLAVHETS